MAKYRNQLLSVKTRDCYEFAALYSRCDEEFTAGKEKVKRRMSVKQIDSNKRISGFLVVRGAGRIDKHRGIKII